MENIWEAVHQNGSGCDDIDENILQQAKCAKWIIPIWNPAVTRYGVAGVPVHRRFAAVGGKIIFEGKFRLGRLPGL